MINKNCTWCNDHKYKNNVVLQESHKISVFSIIVAMDKNRVIGSNNKLPWNIPEDMKWFVNNTKYKTVVMGRRTYESIGKPLLDRCNVVITRDKNFCSKQGFDNANIIRNGIIRGKIYSDDSLEHALENCVCHEVVIIGGAQIYRSALQYVDKMYITKINYEFEGDAYFPEYENDWKINEISYGHNDQFTYEFQTLERKK